MSFLGELTGPYRQARPAHRRLCVGLAFVAHKPGHQSWAVAKHKGATVQCSQKNTLPQPGRRLRPLWHTSPTEDAVRLASDGDIGLSEPEAARRLTATGLNELIERGGRSPG